VTIPTATTKTKKLKQTAKNKPHKEKELAWATKGG
jgi:hypothetical protein